MGCNARKTNKQTTSNIIQSVCLVGKGRLKERCGLEPRTNFFFRLRNRQKLVRIRFGGGLDSRIYGAVTTLGTPARLLTLCHDALHNSDFRLCYYVCIYLDRSHKRSNRTKLGCGTTINLIGRYVVRVTHT